MAINERQKQTNTNIQEKANLIWEIATHLVGLFKPHEYGKVILPMTVLKRFDDALLPTKDKVVAMAKTLDARGIVGEARDGILCKAAGYRKAGQVHIGDEGGRWQWSTAACPYHL